MKPPPISAWLLAPLVLVPLAGAVLFLMYPKAFTGDEAIITIVSITPTGPGEVEIRYGGRLTVGTTFMEVSRQGKRRYEVLRRTTRDRFPGRYDPLVEGTGSDRIAVYSITNEHGLPTTPEETRTRILVESGRTYKIRSGEPLLLYRYTMPGGEGTERTLEVVPER